MKTALLRVLIPALVLGSMTGSASAAQIPILNVDFNNDSPTVAANGSNGIGFQSFNVSDSPARTYTGLDSAHTTGSVTVTLSNINAWRDRGYTIVLPGGGTFDMSGTYRDLYRDFVAFESNSSSFIEAFRLSGLNPNSEYTLTIHAFDFLIDGVQLLDADTRIMDVTPGGATNGLTADAFFRTDTDPSASITDFSSPAGGSGRFTVRSNSAGVLDFALSDFHSNQQGHPRINGFELSAVASVPEPSSLALACIGGLSTLGTWWRRRRSPGCRGTE